MKSNIITKPTDGSIASSSENGIVCLVLSVNFVFVSI